MTTETDTLAKGAGPSFTITVDGEELTVTERRLTPGTIMERVGIDPATHYLVIIRGRQRESLEGKNDEPIQIHEKLTLVSVFTGETPVS
jgi:hypothetical protein